MSLYDHQAIRQRIVREGINALEQDLIRFQSRGIELTYAQLFALAYERAEQSLAVIEAEVALGICPQLAKGKQQS